MTRDKRVQKAKGCELIACLMKARRTVPEITEMVDISEEVARLWIASLQESGLVRIAGVRKLTGTGTRGPSPVEYEWQTAPFALEDMTL